MKKQKSIRNCKAKIIRPALLVVLGVPNEMEHYNVMVAYKRGWWFIGSGVRILKRA